MPGFSHSLFTFIILSVNFYSLLLFSSPFASSIVFQPSVSLCTQAKGAKYCRAGSWFGTERCSKKIPFLVSTAVSSLGGSLAVSLLGIWFPCILGYRPLQPNIRGCLSRQEGVLGKRQSHPLCVHCASWQVYVGPPIFMIAANEPDAVNVCGYQPNTNILLSVHFVWCSCY